MISLLLTLFYYIVNFLIGLLPTGGVWPTEVHSAFTTLGGYIGIFDAFIPITIMLYCLTTLFSVEIVIFGFKTVRWIAGHIPFLGKGHTT